MKKLILSVIALALIYAVFSLGKNTATGPGKTADLKTAVATAEQKILGEQARSLNQNLTGAESKIPPAAPPAPEPIKPTITSSPKAEEKAAPPTPAPKKEIITKQPIGKTNKAPATQIIKGIITAEQGLLPNSYTVKVGVPVRLEIDPKDDIEGCMSTILIDRLYERASLIKAGEKIVMDFTPKQTGEYYIICVMGIEWGIINVV